MIEHPLTVIIPVYNTPFNLLERAFNSLYNQTLEQCFFEVIVVNDGSDNCTTENLREFEKKYSFTLFEIANKGASLARKFGIDNSKGECVFFMDADDFLPVNALYALFDEYQVKHKPDVVVGQFLLERDGKLLKERAFELINEDPLESYLLHKLPITLWGNLYKKTLFSFVEFMNFLVAEDMIVNSQVYNHKGVIVCVIKEVTYHYCFNSHSLSKTFSSEKVEDGYNAYLTQLEILMNSINLGNPRLKVALCYNLYRMYFALLMLSSDKSDLILEKIKALPSKVIKQVNTYLSVIDFLILNTSLIFPIVPWCIRKMVMIRKRII